MNVRELRWWSTSALGRMCAAIEPAWSRWCETWGIAPSSVAAVNAGELRSQADGFAAGEPLHGAKAWIGSGTLSTQDVAHCLLFGDVPTSPGHGASIASEIAGLAWTDLRHRLAERLDDGNQNSVVDEPAPPSSDFARWSGAVVLHLASSSAAAPRIVLHLSSRGAARLARDARRQDRPVSAPAVQRCSVSEAIRERRVPLRVGLDDVLLDVGTLGSLRCGDVLTLTHRLDQTLRVRFAHADPDAMEPDLCAAVLGARGGQRAVELVRARSAS